MTLATASPPVGEYALVRSTAGVLASRVLFPGGSGRSGRSPAASFHRGRPPPAPPNARRQQPVLRG
jgi:hypothetical protein